jgi:hypothetical protein
MSDKIHKNHRFLDEAGDTTFYGKGKTDILGKQGVSLCFILGMVKFKEPLQQIRDAVVELQNKVAADAYYQVPSILKKKGNQGYFFHATDDIPEVRKLFFDYIKNVNCSFEAVVARKSIERYETTHKGKQEYFYADVLSHLIKNKLTKNEKMVLHISEKGSSTKHTNLNLALRKAIQRYKNNQGGNKSSKDISTEIVFSVEYPTKEPLLNIADYFCWSIQRVFEKGEDRYYNYLKDKISLVIDIYDKNNYKNWENYYSEKNPLTSKNKISPPLH